MNKLFVLCYALVILSCPVLASELSDVSLLEKDLFGVEYKDESITSRLMRIEKHLYGKVNQGTNQERIKKIAETSGISFAPKLTDEQKRIAAAEYEKEDNTVSYPVIDMMEEKVFKMSYQGENVYKRVARLEEKAFGKASQGELSARTDKLKAELLAVKQETNNIYDNIEQNQLATLSPGNGYREIPPANSNYYQENNTLNAPPFSTYGGYPTGGAASSGYSYSNSDFDYALTAAENLIFGKNYSDKSEAERLNRLENKIFKKTFSGDKIARLERVVSAATAKNSGNIYRENKFDRYLSTGMQVGAILLMILAMIL